MGMEDKFLLWIWYYHTLPTEEQMRVSPDSTLYRRLYMKYKDCYKDYFDINPDKLKLSKGGYEQVIWYEYERSMRENVNTSL